MKAAVLKQFGEPLVIEDVPTPQIEDDQVLIKVMACGIDGTDLKMLDGFGYTPQLPFILGHEPAGVVEQVGDRVTQFKPGDRVITYNFFVCGRCRLCLTGREQLCPNMTGTLGARNWQGGYAQYLKIPARQVVGIPPGIDWPDAAVLPDAGITAFHAVDRSGLKLGETVVIFGVGGVGSFAVQIAALAGAKVIAVDQTPAKTQRALQLGADEAIDASRQDVAQTVRDLTAGYGADCVIDIVGKQATISAGIDSLANGARLVIVGYTPEEYALNGKRMAQNELQIIGTRCGPKQDLINVAAMVAAGKLQSIVTDRSPLEKVNEALQRLRSGRVLGRLVLDMPAGA